MNTKKVFGYALITVLIGLAFFACDDKPKQGPHESNINAFDRTIKVKGDASISTADFNTAKGNLQDAFTDLDNQISGSPRTAFVNMLDRAGFAILIKTGNAGPDADANKSMTVGINYLLDNDAIQTIAPAIYAKVFTNNAFAVP